MNHVDFLILAVIAAVLFLAVWYIYRAKKGGKKCIGCPDSGSCSGSCNGNCAGCCGKR